MAKILISNFQGAGERQFKLTDELGKSASEMVVPADKTQALTAQHASTAHLRMPTIRHWHTERSASRDAYQPTCLHVPQLHVTVRRG